MTQLRQVLELEARHCSAKVLLSIARNKQPKTVSAGGVTILHLGGGKTDDGDPHGANGIEAEKSGSVRGRAIRAGGPPQASSARRPRRPPAAGRVVAVHRAWSSFEQGLGSAQGVQRQAQALFDEMAKEDANADMMQKMLKEGI